MVGIKQNMCKTMKATLTVPGWLCKDKDCTDKHPQKCKKCVVGDRAVGCPLSHFLDKKKAAPKNGHRGAPPPTTRGGKMWNRDQENALLKLQIQNL
jgi:hypothetical protein